MAQHPVELILTRQLASQLATPVFLVDEQGTLLFYNEAAEAILGLRFEETGEMAAAEWAEAFTPRDQAGAPLDLERLPLILALRHRRPFHSEFFIRGLDRVVRRVEVTAFPLIGTADRLAGAIAIFWESPAA